MGEEDGAVLMCKREGGSRQASVCFCAAEGEGQTAAQCSAQLLSKLVFLSVCLLPFFFFFLLSLSAGLGLLCLPEHCWQWGNLCEAKQAAALAAAKERQAKTGHTHAKGHQRMNGNQLPLNHLLCNSIMNEKFHISTYFCSKN